MRRKLRNLLNVLGYEIIKVPRSASKNRDFESYFFKTEGMITLEEGYLLYELAKEVKDGCIVEIGSYRGRSSVALGRGSIDGNQVPVFAIEPHESFMGMIGGQFGPQDRGAYYQAMIESSCFEVVRLINLSSEQVAPNWSEKISLLWIDGDHSYKGVKRDYECWEKHLLPGAIVVFDDSLDAQLGPKRLIDELMSEGRLKKIQVVGKVSQFKLTSSSS